MCCPSHQNFFYTGHRRNLTMTTTTLKCGGNSSWAHDNRKAIGLGALVLAILLIGWLIFAPAKITPFTIAKGEGANAHVDFKTAMRLAKQNSIPLVLGKRWDGPRLSYEGALALEGTLDANQVTMLVETGDSFDADGVYHPVGEPFVGDDRLTLEQRETRVTAGM